MVGGRFRHQATLVADGQGPQFRYTVRNTGNVAVDVALSDSEFQALLAADPVSQPGLLAANDAVPGGDDEFVYWLTDLDWVAGQHISTADARANYTDHAGNSATVTGRDEARYFGAAPSIRVFKEVSVDGGETWLAGDSATGPSSEADGQRPQFRYTVKNTGNVAVDVALSDSEFQAMLAADPFSQPGLLAANDDAPGGDDEFVYSLTNLDWVAGQHISTASVRAVYEDSAGNQAAVSDSNQAHYFGRTRDEQHEIEHLTPILPVSPTPVEVDSEPESDSRPRQPRLILGARLRREVEVLDTLGFGPVALASAVEDPLPYGLAEGWLPETTGASGSAQLALMLTPSLQPAELEYDLADALPPQPAALEDATLDEALVEPLPARQLPPTTTVATSAAPKLAANSPDSGWRLAVIGLSTALGLLGGLLVWRWLKTPDLSRNQREIVDRPARTEQTP